MKFLKKILIVVLILAMPMVALATDDYLKIDYMNDAPGSDFNLISFVKVLINWLFYALLVVALIMLIMVGWHYVTTGGQDPTKVKDNGKKLGFILMGIAIALLAKGLIYAACFLVTSGTNVCTFW